MNLKKAKSPVNIKSFKEIKDLFLKEYEKHNPDAEPTEDGTLLVDYQTGEELGLKILNWGWEANVMPKLVKLARQANLVYSYNNSDDLIILTNEVGSWMSKMGETVDKKISEQIDEFYQIGKKPKVRVSQEDFDKFLRWVRITGFKSYNDYTYQDIKEYLN